MEKENCQRAIRIYHTAKKMEYGQNPYFIRIIPFHFYHRYHKHGLEGKPSHGSGRIRLSSGRQKCGQYDYVSAGQGLFQGVAIKIFDDIEKYCEGLANLQKQKPSQVKGGLTGQEQEILDNLLSISL